MIFNEKMFYNPVKLDAAYIIELVEVIEVLNFEPLIIESPPYNIDSEDDKVIEPIENI